LYNIYADNGKEFIVTIVWELLVKNNPNCFLVTGRPRTPQDQGSVESGNKLVSQIRKSLACKCRHAGLEDNWTKYLSQIMACCNSHAGQARQSILNYKAVFGMKYHAGLRRLLSEMRQCQNISERLCISPDERLAKLVEEMDIVDGITDEVLANVTNVDDNEDPNLVDDIIDDDMRYYEERLKYLEGEQQRYNESINQLNNSDTTGIYYDNTDSQIGGDGLRDDGTPYDNKDNCIATAQFLDIDLHDTNDDDLPSDSKPPAIKGLPAVASKMNTSELNFNEEDKDDDDCDYLATNSRPPANTSRMISTVPEDSKPQANSNRIDSTNIQLLLSDTESKTERAPFKSSPIFYTVRSAFLCGVATEQRPLSSRRKKAYMFVYPKLACKCVHKDNQIVEVGDKAYNTSIQSSTCWWDQEFVTAFTTMAAYYAHTCEGRDDSIVLPKLVHLITPRNVLDDSACRPINPNVEKIVGIIHNNNHYAVMEIDIANKIACIYDGLGVAPLLTWSQHIINALQMCQLVRVTAITSTVGDQSQLVWRARTRNKSPQVLGYSIMLDHEEWRLERGGFVAQTDGYNCGPIACLKILEMYSLVSVLDIEVAYSLNGLRRLAMDKWRLFIDYCNNDLVVRRRFDVAIKEPHPMPGMPEQSSLQWQQ
jgi:hypothetical protein